MRVPQFAQPVLGIERMHFKRGDIDQEPRSNELLVEVMFAQHVAHILAQITFDALAKLLDAVDVFLLHSPRPVRGIGRARLKLFDPLFHLVVPGNIGDQVFEVRKCLHRLDGHRLFHRELAEPGHAHQPGHAVYFSRARTAFAGLAVPSQREVVRLFCLDLANGVQHHHARDGFNNVVDELAAGGVASPYTECGCAH